jgi:hypothetical protein
VPHLVLETKEPRRLRGLLLPGATTSDDKEAHKMARLLEELERPYGRDHYELIRAGRDGIYRQAADGLIIRIAAAEAAHEAEGIARHLLDLACRYAAGQ